MNPASVRPTAVRTVFRIVALAEALSWLGLLIAMFFKWIVQDDPHTGLEGGVPIMGPIHGAVFVAFVGLCFVAWRTFEWKLTTLVLALASSIPPFATIWFERRAERAGHLTTPDSSAASSAADAR